jgi:predicted alpha/beta superfamily hydrolase
MRRTLFALALLVVPAAALAQAPAIVREGPAVIAGTQEYVLRSSHSRRDFLVQVAAPVRPLAAGDRAAVIYVLDGDYMFGMATDIARNLQIVREVAPVFVVAVGYPGDSHSDWVNGRLHDMLAAPVEVNGQRLGGGGPAFERFLVDELRPFIEARHPIDPARSYLAGHSLGGLFGASVILNRTGAFAGYAIGSPALWIVPDLVDRLRSAPSAAGPAPRVFVGVGAEESDRDMVGWAQRLTDTLRVRGLEVAHRSFAGEGHVTVEGPVFANALKFLVPAPPPR